jgi:hypothetical protein
MPKNSVEVTLTFKDDGSVVVDQAKKKVQDLDKSVQDSQEPLAGFREGWVAVTAKIGIATAAIYGAVKAVNSFTSEAAEAQDVQNRLGFALQTGGYSWEYYKDQVDAWANSIMKATRFTDEDARRSLTEMLMYTNEYAKAQQGASLAMDMSVRTGMDLSSATRLIGMAVTGNVEMLGRYLPQLRNLDTVLGSNATMADKANYALKILREKFGGTAQADVTSYSGKVKQLSNSWGELKESIGADWLPRLSKTLDYFTAIINKMREQRELMKEQGGGFFGGWGKAPPGSAYMAPVTKAMFGVEEGLPEPLRKDVLPELRLSREELEKDVLVFRQLAAEAERLSEFGDMPDWREWIQYTPKRALPDLIELEMNLNKVRADAERLSEFGDMPDWREWIEYTPKRALPDIIQLNLELAKTIAQAELLSAEGKMPSWLDALETQMGKGQADWRRNVGEMDEVWKSLGQNISSVWSENVTGIIKGTSSIGEAFKNMAGGMADAFISAITKMIAQWVLFGSATGNVSATKPGTSFFGTSSGGYGGIIGGILNIFGAAKAEGGYFPGPFIPIKTFQGGGYVNRPTLGMIGEGGEGEWVIPDSRMPKGRGDIYVTNIKVDATDVQSFEKRYGPSILAVSERSARGRGAMHKIMRRY